MSLSAWHRGRLRGRGEPGVIFGFQHEESACEGRLFGETKGGRALCVASGGETAFSLLAAGAEEVVAVDLNPAQFSLIEAKNLAILRGRGDWIEGDASSLPDEPGLPEEAARFWRRRRGTLRQGLCFTGVVERRTRMAGPLLRWFAARPRGWRWGVGAVLLRAAITAGYAGRFRRSLPRAWFARLASRLEKAAASTGNDPLWSAERGLGFGAGGLPLYRPESMARLAARLPRLRWVEDDLVALLRREKGESWDFIALSNLIDTLGEDERTDLCELAASRLRPGGIFVVRSIVHPPEALPPARGWEWLAVPPDSGVICPLIGVGRKSG